jgi:vacuolar-type H+-ATPase subunit H
VRRKDRSPKPSSPARGTAERIEAIVEAAERAAESVIDDAERQAAGYLAEAQAEADRVVAERLSSLSELTDSLLARADAISGQTESMVELLKQAKARIEAGGEPAARSDDQERPGQAGSRGSHLSAVAAPQGEDPELTALPTPPAEQERRTPAGARLLATQMAVSGSSREEIALRLRNGFEIEDTAAILDAILGPED